MAYDASGNRFNPLIIGAVAVVVALAAFLIFREGTDTTQQAGVESAPPAATTPPPSATPPPKNAPATSRGSTPR